MYLRLYINNCEKKSNNFGKTIFTMRTQRNIMLRQKIGEKKPISRLAAIFLL